MPINPYREVQPTLLENRQHLRGLLDYIDKISHLLAVQARRQPYIQVLLQLADEFIEELGHTAIPPLQLLAANDAGAALAQNSQLPKGLSLDFAVASIFLMGCPVANEHRIGIAHGSTFLGLYRQTHPTISQALLRFGLMTTRAWETPRLPTLELSLNKPENLIEHCVYRISPSDSLWLRQIVAYSWFSQRGMLIEAHMDKLPKEGQTQGFATRTGWIEATDPTNNTRLFYEAGTWTQPPTEDEPLLQCARSPWQINSHDGQSQLKLETAMVNLGPHAQVQGRGVLIRTSQDGKVREELAGELAMAIDSHPFIHFLEEPGTEGNETLVVNGNVQLSGKGRYTKTINGRNACQFEGVWQPCDNLSTLLQVTGTAPCH